MRDTNTKSNQHGECMTNDEIEIGKSISIISIWMRWENRFACWINTSNRNPRWLLSRLPICLFISSIENCEKTTGSMNFQRNPLMLIATMIGSTRMIVKQTSKHERNWWKSHGMKLFSISFQMTIYPMSIALILLHRIDWFAKYQFHINSRLCFTYS